MKKGLALTLVSIVAMTLSAASRGEEGLRVTSRVVSGGGIDPSLAPAWLNPERERFGFASYHWRDAVGFSATSRMQFAYPLGGHTSLGLSVASGKDYDSAPVYGAEGRQYGLFGHYSFTPDWSLSAGSFSRDPNTLLRLQDFRIGVRRQF